MSPATRIDPYLAGNFLVKIEGLTATAFSEVLGLEAAIDVVDYRTGDLKENTPQKLPGLNRYPNVTLKRGLTGDLSLWNWIESALQGTLVRTGVTITLLDQSDNPVLTWQLKNAWPCRWTGPSLIANSSEVAIETLEICHEGLELVVPG
ncbi:MAG: phage tail protein [Terracidiphilus sp.]